MLLEHGQKSVQIVPAQAGARRIVDQDPVGLIRVPANQSRALSTEWQRSLPPAADRTRGVVGKGRPRPILVRRIEGDTTPASGGGREKRQGVVDDRSSRQSRDTAWARCAHAATDPGRGNHRPAPDRRLKDPIRDRRWRYGGPALPLPWFARERLSVPTAVCPRGKIRAPR